MIRRATLVWRDRDVGTIPIPESFRPPVEPAVLAIMSRAVFVGSRSWLFRPRPGDLTLELRGHGEREEVVVVASPRLGTGDLGCIIGFVPAPGCEDFVDEEMLGLADQVLREMAGSGNG